MNKVFKKIFDLDPEVVEDYIRKDVEAKFAQSDDPESINDFDIRINWHPTCNEFYVFTDPKLDHDKNWEHYYFKGKSLTLDEYLPLTFDHWHYTFQEIYGYITGEIVYNEPIWLVGDTEHDKKAYDFIYQKKHVTVYDYKDGHAAIVEYDDKTESDVFREVPEDLMQEVIKLRNN